MGQARLIGLLQLGDHLIARRQMESRGVFGEKSPRIDPALGLELDPARLRDRLSDIGYVLSSFWRTLLCGPFA